MLTIKDIANDLNVTMATVRTKLKTMSIEKQPNGRLLITEDQYNNFLYRFYPSVYAKRNGCVLALERTMNMKQLNKGKIQKIVQKSGNIYYYIRNFPVAYDSKGNVIYHNTTIGYKTKEEALAAREELVVKRSMGLLEGTAKEIPKEPTFVEYITELYERRKDDLAYGTYERYMTAIAVHFRPFFKTTPIKGLTIAKLDTFVDSHCRTKNNTVRSILKTSLLHLYKKRILRENLYDFITFPSVSKERPNRKPLTTDELKALFSYYKGHRLEHAIHLHFKTGLRRGELQALYWSDIQLNEDFQIVVDVKYSYGKTEIGYARKAPKTPSSVRKVIIYDEYLWHLLRNARKTYGHKCKWVVFNKRLTGTIDPVLFNTFYYSRVGKLLGFSTPLSTHIARHTFISHSLAAGIQAENIAKQVGHIDTSMIHKVYGKAVQAQADWYKSFRLI